MRFVCVVQSRILGLQSIQRSIEMLDFLTDLRDQVALHKGKEVLWFVGLGFRKLSAEDDFVDVWSSHFAVWLFFDYQVARRVKRNGEGSSDEVAGTLGRIFQADR